MCRVAQIQEQGKGVHYHDGAELLGCLVDKTVLEVKDGYLPIPTGRGLGIDIDEAFIEQSAKEMTGQWRNPIWKLEDGCLAEW